MGFGDWFKGLEGETQAAFVQGGTGLLGGILGGIGEGKRDAANRQFQYDQLASQDRNAAANRALQASQSDPLATQLARQRAALFASLLPGMRNMEVKSNIPGMDHFIPQISGGMRLPGGGISPGALAFSTPEAMANAEAQHWRTLGVQAPDLGTVGYGQAGTDAMNRANAGRSGDAQSAAIQNTLRGKPPKGYEYDKKTGELKKKGGGFLGALKKIGKIALPIAAIAGVPFTGGASLAGLGIGAVKGLAGRGKESGQGGGGGLPAAGPIGNVAQTFGGGYNPWDAATSAASGNILSQQSFNVQDYLPGGRYATPRYTR